MSHDIDNSTGKPAMAYVGELPWHSLGERLPPGRDIDEWVRAARLDWEIRMLPVSYQFEGRNLLMPDRCVLARSDSGAALSIVSNEYLVVQPKEVLEFYRDLVATRHYTLETAGALDGGRKVWALAKTGLVKGVAGDPADKLGAYVLLATSCDKSLATTATFTSVRVVCQNTLTFAMHDMKDKLRRSIKIDHTRKFDPAEIREELGLMDESFERFLEQINPMAAQKVSDSDASLYFQSLFQSDRERQEGKPLSVQKLREINQLVSIYKSADSQQTKAAKGTLWGALNAVTYYVDHVRAQKTGDRLDSAWFGSGNLLKEKAWELALEVSSVAPS
jgi:phage/plasmid-like protein (TIGR03299 family)